MRSTPRTIDWSQLDWRAFQRLVNRLLFVMGERRIENSHLRRSLPFAALGKDFQIDGLYEGQLCGAGGKWLVQCKFSVNPNVSPARVRQWLSNKEIAKYAARARSLGADHLLVATNWEVNHQTYSDTVARIRQAGIEGELWSAEELNNYLALVVSPRSAFTIHGLGRDPLARGRTSALPRGRRGRL